MMAGWFARGTGLGGRKRAAVVACLLLTMCAGPSTAQHWVKAGADETTTAGAISDCRAQANAAQNREQGINQDISATLGRNWQLSQTSGLQAATMHGQAAGLAGQVFSSCMHAKGFSPRS